MTIWVNGAIRILTEKMRKDGPRIVVFHWVIDRVERMQLQSELPPVRPASPGCIICIRLIAFNLKGNGNKEKKL